MQLRGRRFGPVMGASGIQGFFGEGYPYHSLYKGVFPRRFCFDGMTFVAKTVTLNRREGNMPLEDDGTTPKERFPKCIFVNASSFRQGAALNAVGLSNFGAKFYFEDGRWQERWDGFFLSFMSVENSLDDRFAEWKEFVDMFLSYLSKFHGEVGLQKNYSCPNLGKDVVGHSDELIYEIHRDLSLDSRLRVPFVPKINFTVSPRDAAKIADHPACDALCVSNTLPWGAMPDRIDWKGIFGTDESPLKHLGGGGLSGAPLRPLLVEWLNEAKYLIKKPLIIGGGVMGSEDVHSLSLCDPAAISLGTIAMLRPWRVAGAIKAAHEYIKQ